MSFLGSLWGFSGLVDKVFLRMLDRCSRAL